ALFKKIQLNGGIALIHDSGHGIGLDQLGIKATLFWHHKNNGAETGQYIYPGRDLRLTLLNCASIQIEPVLLFWQHRNKTDSEITLLVPYPHIQQPCCL